MTTTIENSKRFYQAPIIENIRLDNEISLALESTPPAGPDETHLMESNQINPLTSFA